MFFTTGLTQLNKNNDIWKLFKDKLGILLKAVGA